MVSFYSLFYTESLSFGSIDFISHHFVLIIDTGDLARSPSLLLANIHHVGRHRCWCSVFSYSGAPLEHLSSFQEESSEVEMVLFVDSKDFHFILPLVSIELLNRIVVVSFGQSLR